LKYVFRPQLSGRQFGLASTGFVAAYSQEKFGKAPKDLRIAIIHEDGPYGVDVARGTEEGARKAGFNIVVNEGYSATAPDLSSLVTKLKREPMSSSTPATTLTSACSFGRPARWDCGSAH